MTTRTPAGKPSHDVDAAVSLDVIADTLARLPDILSGILAEMPGVSIEDETIVADHMMTALKTRGMAMVHVHADFLSMDIGTARETLAKMLPAPDGSDGQTVIVVSGMGHADRVTLGLIDQMVLSMTDNNGPVPSNAKCLLLRSNSSHNTGVINRLFKMDVRLPEPTSPSRRRTGRWVA